ncbi:MAG: hypothetical protein ACKKMW_01560 [Candidatus Nealsonbacteria bacterium]
MKKILINLINFLQIYSGAISIIFLISGILWALFKFRIYIKDRRFGIYHKLIQELVEPESPNKPLKLDRQIAIIFELRNFPEYYEVSRRILSGLKENWKDVSVERVIEEIDISLKYMESNKICRFCHNLLNFIKY